MKLYYLSVLNGINVKDVKVKLEKNVFISIEKTANRLRLNRNKDINLILNPENSSTMCIFTFEDKLKESEEKLKAAYIDLMKSLKEKLALMEKESSLF